MHSPLVGPSTMRPLAAALRGRGWTAVAPDLRHAAVAPDDFVAAAAYAGSRADVVVGHSGAGAMLPAVAGQVGARFVVYIDAVLPEATTTFRPSTGFLEFVDTLPVHDGLLPPWHQWWPAATVAALLPDEATRRAVTEEIPALPWAFYDHALELPAEWWTSPAAYLRLSPAYDEELGRARALGWPTVVRAGRHLDLVVRPEVTADDVLGLIDALRS